MPLFERSFFFLVVARIRGPRSNDRRLPLGGYRIFHRASPNEGESRMVAGSCTSLTALFQELLENGASPYHAFPRLDWMFIASMPLCEVMHADFSSGKGFRGEQRKTREKKRSVLMYSDFM